MEHVFNLRSNTCICIFIVSFQRTCKKLDFVLHHGFQTPRNKWKQTAYCLVFSSVSRCLEPVMKHLPSFLTYYFKHSMIANITAFLFFFFFFFSFSIFLDRGQVKVHVSVNFRLRSIPCACKFLNDSMVTVKIIIPWPTPKKSQDCKKTYLAA